MFLKLAKEVVKTALLICFVLFTSVVLHVVIPLEYLCGIYFRSGLLLTHLAILFLILRLLYFATVVLNTAKHDTTSFPIAKEELFLKVNQNLSRVSSLLDDVHYRLNGKSEVK
jgi:hypothetical protein